MRHRPARHRDGAALCGLSRARGGSEPGEPAYAQRKTRELGLANVDYAQADILRLDQGGRNFDVIEAVGVLHHMADPIAGWRVLATLLRPGGFMKLGLYSARARAHIVRARRLIAERGYGSTAEDIRQFRHELRRQSDVDARMLKESTDFYSTSGCRDLLFHVREHYFTLPEIAQTLEALQLAFVGFEIAEAAKQRYRHVTRAIRQWPILPPGIISRPNIRKPSGGCTSSGYAVAERFVAGTRMVPCRSAAAIRISRNPLPAWRAPTRTSPPCGRSSDG
ncbi:MAG: methyltransferase [Pseudomonadota bacterium]